MTTETLAYHNYVIQEQRQSTIDPDATIAVDVAMRCPRCKAKQPLMDHADSRTCEHCGLRMQLYGNGLHCS